MEASMRAPAPIVAVLSLPMALSSLAHAVTYQTAALSGQPVPGASAGITYSNFGNSVSECRPRIDNLGNLAFTAYLTGTGVDASNDTGVFTGAIDGMHLLARTGQPAAGFAPGITYQSLACNALINGGYSSFQGYVAGPGITTANDQTYWYSSAGQVSVVAREGTQAPGTDPGVLYSGLMDRVLSSSGVITFPAKFGTAEDRGIWTGTPGSFQLILQSGVNPTGTVGQFGLGQGRANSAGDIVFNGGINGPDSYGAIWLRSGGTTELVARTGIQAPQLPSGVIMSGFQWQQISEAGNFAFFSRLSGTGVTTANDTAIWGGRPGALHLLAREGAQA